MSSLHGFQSWLDFGKATLSLGTMLTLGIYAILTFALDGRYAPAALAATVAANGDTAEQVQAQVTQVQGSLVDLKEVILLDQIFAMKAKMCQTSGEARRFRAERLTQLEAQYQDLEGRRAIVPACEDLQ